MISDAELPLQCLPAAMGGGNTKLSVAFTTATPRQVSFDGQDYTLIGSCAADGRRVAVLLTDRNTTPEIVILNPANSETVFRQPARPGDTCLVQEWGVKQWFENPNYPTAWLKTYERLRPFPQDVAVQHCQAAVSNNTIRFFINNLHHMQAYCGAVTVQTPGQPDVIWAISMQQGKKQVDATPQDIMAWMYCQVRSRLSACANDPDTQERLEFLRAQGGSISPAACPALLAQ